MVVANIQPLKWVMCTCWQLNAHVFRNKIHGIRFIRIERRNITPLTVFTCSNIPEFLVFTDDLMRYKLFTIIIVRILCEIVWNRIECTGTSTVDFFCSHRKQSAKALIFERVFSKIASPHYRSQWRYLSFTATWGGNWFLFIRLTTIWWLYLS